MDIYTNSYLSVWIHEYINVLALIGLFFLVDMNLFFPFLQFLYIDVCS